MRTAAVIMGESLREAGVLIVVFHGVSVLIPVGRSLGAAAIAGGGISVVLGLLLWWYGAMLELEGW